MTLPWDVKPTPIDYADIGIDAFALDTGAARSILGLRSVCWCGRQGNSHTVVWELKETCGLRCYANDLEVSVFGEMCPACHGTVLWRQANPLGWFAIPELNMLVIVIHHVPPLAMGIDKVSAFFRYPIHDDDVANFVAIFIVHGQKKNSAHLFLSSGRKKKELWCAVRLSPIIALFSCSDQRITYTVYNLF